MRIAVVGAGVIGVTTAYELAVDGHQVTVFERRGSVAGESSFANAGIVAPGYVKPWAAPGMPGRMLLQLLRRHGPVRLGAVPDAALLRWLWRWTRACSPAASMGSRGVLHRLARYSHERLQSLAHELRLDYEQDQGVLVLLRERQDVALARAGLKLLAELGVDFHLVDAAQCRRIEPGLNAETPLQAGVHLAQDGVGNCRQFALLLRTEAQRLGATFRLQQQVLSITPGRTVTVHHAAAGSEAPTDAGAFDAVVVCAALGSAPLLAPLGLRLPLAPVYGYSITAPLRRIEGHPEFGPRTAVMDERYKVAISRLGQRVRVAGGAELGGSPDCQSPALIATLYKVLHDWYPGAAQLGQAQRWKGARPMLPDGPPVIGPAGADGVWLNLGHGSSGWALACGSARVLADRIAGRPAAIDVSGLGVVRLG